MDALGVAVWVPGAQEVKDKIVSRGLIPVDTANEPTDPIPRKLRLESASHEVELYIFTSGTTGKQNESRHIAQYILFSSRPL